ncbi:transcriptional regulator NanR [Rhodobacteraceae bacterium XHP0102]|nr:transcriptional regulator NanR [Rhodobacteraceae bacterium XHP0102]
MTSIPDSQGRMTEPNETIRPKKLSDEVEDRLLALIREDHLKPGDALPSERALMARYGIGRPAIREAMQSLQHKGVIDIRHGGKPRLATPSLDGLVDQLAISMRHILTHSQSSLEHLKEARTALEVEMVRIAAARRSADDLNDLEQLLRAQAAARHDVPLFTQIDGQFHRRISAISGNPIFETLTQGVFSWMSAFHKEQVHKLGLEPVTLAEHRAILDGIAKQDGAAAAHAMREHLERANALYHQDHAQ